MCTFHEAKNNPNTWRDHPRYSSSGFHNHGFLVGKSPFSEMGLWNPFQMAQKWFINGGDPNQDTLQIRMNLALSPESREVETIDF